MIMKKNQNRLLLHTCCADCAIKAVEGLKSSFPKENITLYFDNSNIHPRSEYVERLNAVKQIAKENNIELKITNWSKNSWLEAVGYNEDNENLRRCRKCWKLRLGNTAGYAIENEFENFSTTLLTSHYQNTKVISDICISYETSNLKFIPIPKSEKICTSGFYKQNYCGCIFSLKDKYLERGEN